MTRRISTPVAAGALLGAALAGCTSMSGVGGSPDYGCKAPQGVTCESVSGTYANASQHKLPSQRKASDRPATGAAQQAPGAASSATIPRVAGVAPTPVALRSSPRILRLWFKPWEDADHDLHDQGYVYVQIDAGRWQVEHVQRHIRDAHAPVKAPPRAAAGANDSSPFPPNAKSPARPDLPLPARPMPAEPRARGDTDGDTDK
ncbi:TraV family lipoprotein [Aquabacterium humicola]|uniref:TraV family lipoprotein n=1 Tax=Aquabacterium humicola TaxID=3237377 RepID=UPI002543039C|nr:TraV family lipoprotein [Rubrivivax pictus]